MHEFLILVPVGKRTRHSDLHFSWMILIRYLLGKMEAIPIEIRQGRWKMTNSGAQQFSLTLLPPWRKTRFHDCEHHQVHVTTRSKTVPCLECPGLVRQAQGSSRSWLLILVQLRPVPYSCLIFLNLLKNLD